jgi:hypothetical protein
LSREWRMARPRHFRVSIRAYRDATSSRAAPSGDPALPLRRAKCSAAALKYRRTSSQVVAPLLRVRRRGRARRRTQRRRRCMTVRRERLMPTTCTREGPCFPSFPGDSESVEELSAHRTSTSAAGRSLRLSRSPARAWAACQRAAPIDRATPKDEKDLAHESGSTVSGLRPATR